MVAKSEEALLADRAIEALTSSLFGRATLLILNLPKAAKLVGEGSANTQASALLELGVGAVLMKDGHADGVIDTDQLVLHTGKQGFSSQRVNTCNTHDMGCSYSSAIAAGLAQGMKLSNAVSRVHTWLHQSILHADGLHVGQGHGPVHHFHAIGK